MATIAIMGGTFDPLHIGHLAMADAVFSHQICDEVWFMPAGDPPHKHNKKVTSADDRAAMVKLAIAGCPGWHFCDEEILSPTPSYTARTLPLLYEKYPQHMFRFLIGADSLVCLPQWKNPEALFAVTHFIVFPRQGLNVDISALCQQYRQIYQARITVLPDKIPAVSSTQIREAIHRGQEQYIRSLLPPPVYEYILSHGLYRHQ